MTYSQPTKATRLATIAAVGLLGAAVSTQGDVKPTNDLPNPYQSIENYFKLPDGRTWGSTSAVEIDKDGKSIWVAERCGANSCLDEGGQIKNIPTVLKFDSTGKLVKSFGEGMMIFPHGIYVDRDGNVWVTDGQDNAPRPARGTGAARSDEPGTTAGARGTAGGGGAENPATTGSSCQAAVAAREPSG